MAFDPRDNRKSDRPEELDQYSIEKIVTDVIAIMDDTNTKKAVLVGLSFSSAISFAVGAYYPERIAAVVATGGWSPIVPPKKERFEAYKNAPVPYPEGWDKYNAGYWQTNYPEFSDFFMSEVFNEQHSTKQREDAVAWGLQDDGELLRMTQEAREDDRFSIDEDMYRWVTCLSLIFVGDNDDVALPETSRKIAELTGGELLVIPGAGHGLHARFRAKFDTIMRDFLARHLGSWKPVRNPKKSRQKRALYLSSPIGLGHARRDLAVTQELRKIHPYLQVDWLAQNPDQKLHGFSGSAGSRGL